MALPPAASAGRGRCLLRDRGLGPAAGEFDAIRAQTLRLHGTATIYARHGVDPDASSRAELDEAYRRLFFRCRARGLAEGRAADVT